MGNRKGVFTRQRQPKAAAHLLRQRWLEKLPRGQPTKAR
jgi:beta-glucuronidase